MESVPNNNQSEKRVFTDTEKAIQAYFLSDGDAKRSFETLAEAESRVEEINKEYGNIAFVAEDRGGFVVKFKAVSLGEGFDPVKSEDSSNDLEKAA